MQEEAGVKGIRRSFMMCIPRQALFGLSKEGGYNRRGMWPTCEKRMKTQIPGCKP